MCDLGRVLQEYNGFLCSILVKHDDVILYDSGSTN